MPGWRVATSFHLKDRRIPTRISAAAAAALFDRDPAANNERVPAKREISDRLANKDGEQDPAVVVHPK